METLTETSLFSINATVPVTGNYVCVPCGYIQYFEAGSLFTPCLACLAGTSDGPMGYQEEADEFWQLI